MDHPQYNRIGTLLFYSGFALLACHEMDAVARHEWRLLPGLSGLEDGVARDLFTLLHLPAYILILWCGTNATPATIAWTRRLFCLFLAIHGVLHFSLSGHALYEFVPPVETITVYGGALVGVAYLVWEWRGRPKPS